MVIESSEPRRKRRRPPKACEQCRKRKVRCDQNSPCNQCIRLKIDNCTYDPQTIVDRDAKKPKLKNKPMSGSALPTPASTVDQESISRHPSHNVSLSAATSPSALRTGPLTDPVQPSLNSADILEEDILHVKVLSCTTRAPGPTHSGLHGTVTKTRLVGRSHWMNVVEQFSWVMKLQVQLSTGDKDGDIMAMLDRCKNIGRAIKSQTYSELRTLPHIKDYVPTKDVADDLVENYFRVFESYYRILHIPSFRREYAQFWTTPESVGQTFIIKLLLVLAIGSSVTNERTYNSLHTSAMEWINAAHAWLTSPFTEKTRLSVSAVQVHCLLLFARESVSVSPDLIWISAGSLLRAAMLTGLHRDPSHFPRLSACQSEIRRRLWATVMELCLQSAMNAGGLPMISADMYDCRPPGNLDDEDLDSETGSIAKPRDEITFTQTSVQIALLQTFLLRYKIARMLNDFRIDPSFTDALKLGSQLSEAFQKISHRLKPGHPTHTSSILTYDLMTKRFLLGLHQNFALKALTDPNFYYSRKVCLDTSLLVFSMVCPPSSPPTPDFAHYLTSSSGATKNVILLALLLITIELVAQLDLETPDFHHPMQPTISDTLVRREMFRIFDVYSDYTLDRIRKGETNIKGYVFGQCGVGHLKAIVESNGNVGVYGDVEKTALDEARKALKTAMAILEQKLKDANTPRTENRDGLDENVQGLDDLGVLGMPVMPFIDDFGWDDWDFDGNLGAGEFFMPEH